MPVMWLEFQLIWSGKAIKLKPFFHGGEDELRSLAARGEKPLCSLVALKESLLCPTFVIFLSPVAASVNKQLRFPGSSFKYA